MPTPLTLISHALCPYVQRAAIVLAEKDVPFERIYIDLANKPEWFRAASPLGKVPLLKIGESQYLFESAPIVEFLDETEAVRLHPDSPQERARHRAYVEFASQCLNGIGALYNAKSSSDFLAAAQLLKAKFTHMNDQVSASGPFFAGERFTLVDAAFGPVFRYFDVFETFTQLELFSNLDRIDFWRQALAQRPSVVNAVASDYSDLLLTFLENRNSWMSRLLADQHNPLCRNEQCA
ncbi:MAG: glutathione S-transferase family protein [Roseibium sp.]|uniref:glutathione S-transferase family protein n=1 Tax=Roseibium sp. TaxID=1936156 RepID=UPI00261AC90F|nr:glutathione S-transferase family protein [Roseibium sp.]MCV0429487.1 glutathione S-transferase family protein [Roseibium sp.]